MPNITKIMTPSPQLMRRGPALAGEAWPPMPAMICENFYVKMNLGKITAQWLDRPSTAAYDQIVTVLCSYQLCICAGSENSDYAFML